MSRAPSPEEVALVSLEYPLHSKVGFLPESLCKLTRVVLNVAEIVEVRLTP